jgi:hypothetical protein
MILHKLFVPQAVIDNMQETFPDRIPRRTTASLEYLQGQQSVIDYLILLNEQEEA